MNFTESIKVGITGINSHKLRSFLTVLGIVFGVSAVIAMLSIGEGAKQESLEQIALMGMNNIIIRNKTETNNPLEKSDNRISLKDMQAIKSICPYVEKVTPQVERRVMVQYRDNTDEVLVIGTDENYLSIFNHALLKGRFINSEEVALSANVVVIGSGIKDKLFRFEDPIGKQIKVKDIWFNVIGVLEPKLMSAKKVEGLDVNNQNYEVIVPINSVINRISVRDPNANNRRRRRDPTRYIDKVSIDQMAIKIINAEDIAESSSLINRILLRRHNNVPNFQIVIPEELLRQSQQTQRIFNVVMGAIAGISLLVGGIGIMNIMLASVLERTKEIGVRRAMGATKNDILLQFLIEAVALSIIGGLIGLVLGFGMTKLISSYAGWRTLVNSWSIVLSIGVSLITGLIFGIYPAKNAAEKEPIDALRYE
jgi:putative ABC transport system permease protein